ncbi:MAG: glycosyltransferase [Nitrososphaerota archaeon]
MFKKPYIIACIPAYNEEETIAKVIIKTQKYVDKVIVCDDGGKDMTAEIAEKMGAIVIKHEKKFISKAI